MPPIVLAKLWVALKFCARYQNGDVFLLTGTSRRLSRGAAYDQFAISNRRLLRRSAFKRTARWLWDAYGATRRENWQSWTPGGAVEGVVVRGRVRPATLPPAGSCSRSIGGQQDSVVVTPVHRCSFIVCQPSRPGRSAAR
jgi:hypothetical protein